MRVRLKLEADTAFLNSFKEALTPDDIPPEGFRIHSLVEGSALIYEVSFALREVRELLTALSIVDEVISLAKVCRSLSRLRPPT